MSLMHSQKVGQRRARAAVAFRVTSQSETHVLYCVIPCSVSPFPVPAVLVGLYEEPERPPNAVDYIKKYMGAPTGVDIDAMRAENERLKAENKQLQSTLEELNERVIDCVLLCFVVVVLYSVLYL